MKHQSPELETTFGYLSAIQSPEHGYFGGYLIVSTLGRPLEFHCTAPVLASRAQQILYGPTLHTYLLGDQIGGALLNAAKLTPRLILTNQPEMAGLRGRARVPIVLVLGSPANPRPDSADSSDEPGDNGDASGQSAMGTAEGHADWHSPFGFGSQRFQLPPGFESEQVTVVELLSILSKRVELAEPFDRIHEAIREAQRIGGRSADGHAQAA